MHRLAAWTYEQTGAGPAADEFKRRIVPEHVSELNLQPFGLRRSGHPRPACPVVTPGLARFIFLTAMYKKGDILPLLSKVTEIDRN